MVESDELREWMLASALEQQAIFSSNTDGKVTSAFRAENYHFDLIYLALF